MEYEVALMENGEAVKFVGMNVAGMYVYKKVGGKIRYICRNPREAEEMTRLGRRIQRVKIKEWLK